MSEEIEKLIITRDYLYDLKRKINDFQDANGHLHYREFKGRLNINDIDLIEDIMVKYFYSAQKNWNDRKSNMQDFMAFIMIIYGVAFFLSVIAGEYTIKQIVAVVFVICWIVMIVFSRDFTSFILSKPKTSLEFAGYIDREIALLEKKANQLVLGSPKITQNLN